ncbi:MAG: LamG domain-containing protein [Nocardioidaceae bacterium]|nr:LamG domain-containing protein [Nocardioidaceae bacterium]
MRGIAVSFTTAVVLAAGSFIGSATGAAAPADAAATPDGLILRYAFERIPDGVVTDLAGSLDGQVVNADGLRVRAASLPGYGYALKLRGQNHQFVDVPRSPVLDVDRYTLAAWVRYTGVENDLTRGRWEVLEKAASYWMNVRTDGHVRVGGFFGGCSGPGVWQYLDSTATVVVGRWTHLAATYNGATLRVYVDGLLAGSKAVTGRTCVSGEPLAVGAKNNPSKGLLEAFWDGRLDEVRIYDHALTASEVGQLAARSTG